MYEGRWPLPHLPSGARYPPRADLPVGAAERRPRPGRGRDQKGVRHEEETLDRRSARPAGACTGRLDGARVGQRPGVRRPAVGRGREGTTEGRCGCAGALAALVRREPRSDRPPCCLLRPGKRRVGLFHASRGNLLVDEAREPERASAARHGRNEETWRHKLALGGQAGVRRRQPSCKAARAGTHSDPYQLLQGAALALEDRTCGLLARRLPQSLARDRSRLLG